MKKQTSKPQPALAEPQHNSPILQQVKSLRRSWTATIIGGILGGAVPLIVYNVAHNKVQQHPYLWVLVAGGLLFSASNVYRWSYLATKKWYIAAGFTLLMEAALTFTIGWTSVLALAILIGVNAISYAHAIVVGSLNTGASRSRTSKKKSKTPKSQLTSLNLKGSQVSEFVGNILTEQAV